ncbi:hypothetical protein [Gordonia effusa]|nr:hypothetical protein [Gordonia effusa]
MSFSVGDRVVTTIGEMSPFRDVENLPTPLVGKVVRVRGIDVRVEVTGPGNWAGETIEFTSDLLKHID